MAAADPQGTPDTAYALALDQAEVARYRLMAEQAAVAAATALVAAAGLANVTVREGRADRTGLAAASRDVVMLLHVVAHNGGAEDAIVAHLAGLLRPGGCLYLVD